MISPDPNDFKQLFEEAPGLYLILRPDLTIVAVSDAYLKATMTRREEITGRGLFEVFPDNPEDPTASGVSNLRASLDHVRKHKTAHTMAVQKYDIRRPDGSFEERFWSPLNKPVLDENGQLKFIIHRVEDVTEFVALKNEGVRGQKQREDMKLQIQEMEMEIFKRAQEIQERNRELESFSYSISHDLKAPLRIINGYSEILHTDYRDKLDEEGNRVIDIIRNNTLRMNRLIDALLSLSQVGRKEIIMELTDMNNLVQSVVADQLTFSPSHIDIRLEKLDPVHCDSSLLRQVWVNLVSNAIKYSSKKEKPVITIKSDRKESEIIYAIKDNGVGFDMKYADKLFGVFQRLHKPTEYEGTGIGLALANRIVTRHGGKIWVEAEKEKGATFYFSLVN